MTKDADYFAEHLEEFDLLTEEEKSQVANGLQLQDAVSGEDISEEIDSGVEENGKLGEEKPESQPVIMAKDGKHTISFETFASFRDKAGQLEKLTAQQAELISKLQEAKAIDDAAGNLQATKDVIDEYDGDFSEVYQDLSPHIKSLIDKQVNARIAEALSKVEERIKPVEQRQVSAAQAEHLKAIADAHPDYESVVISKEFAAWFGALPDYAKTGVKGVLEKGSASEINEVLFDYKETLTNGPKAKSSLQGEISKAKQSLEGITPLVPGTLSDIPGGTAGTVDSAESLLGMTDAQMAAFMAGKTPEQVDKILSRLL